MEDIAQVLREKIAFIGFSTLCAICIFTNHNDGAVAFGIAAFLAS